MKKSLYILSFLLLFTIALFVNCTHEKQSSDEVTSTDTVATSELSVKKDTLDLSGIRDPKADSIHIVREIPVKSDFFQITNISNSLVEYHVGPNKITVEGDSATIETMKFDFDGGILTVSTPMEVNNDLPYTPFRSDVVVHVSSPELVTIANCGGGGFLYHGTLKGDFIQLGGLVAGSIDIDSISCQRFRYDSNGDTSLTIGGIHCSEGIVVSTGGGALSLGLTATENAFFDIGGKSSLTAHVISPKISSINGSEGRIRYTIETEKLSLRAVSGEIELNGYAKEQDIQVQNHPTIINNLE